MPYPSHLPANALLENGAGLRALARGLLADEHAAEDVVQDTWLKAMERPPRHAGGFAGWLRQVATSIALKRKRGEGRRSSRERSVSREESTAAVDDVIAQRELLKLVVDGILQLDERYQRVVLLRYYQDWTPRQIAERLDMPIATVESQLHRARTKLRGWLEARTSDRDTWMRALALLTGWNAEAAAAAGSATLAGGLSMYWKTLLVSGAAAAALFRLAPGTEAEPAVAGSRPAPTPELGTAAPALQGLEAAGAPANAQVQDNDSERTAVEPRRERTLSLEDLSAGPFEYRLSGRVVDEFERPVPGATVSIAPLGDPLNRWGRTQNDGAFSIAWSAATPSMDAVLSVSSGAGSHAPLRLQLRAADALEVRVHMNPGPSRRRLVQLEEDLGQLREIQFAASREVELRDRELQLTYEQSRVAASLDRAAASLLPSTPLLHDGHEDGGAAVRFNWPLAPIEVVERDDLQARHLEEVQRYERLVEIEEVRRQRELDVQMDLLAQEHARAATPFSIRGIVSNSAGEPAAYAPIHVARGPRSWSGRTDGEGAFALSYSDDTRSVVRIGGGAFGTAENTFTFDEKTPAHTWNPVLDRGREVSGRVLGPDGEPLVGWTVEWRHDRKGVWAKSATTAAGDGAFALPGLPAGRGTLLLRGPRAPFARKLVSGVFSDSRELEISLSAEELALASTTLRIVDANGEPVSDAEVRVWQASSARARRVAGSGEAGLYEIEHLPPGRYGATIVHALFGTHELDDFWVEHDEALELGTVQLTDSGRLQAEVGGATEHAGAQWHVWRRDGVVGTHFASANAKFAIDGVLPAGEYVLSVHGDELATAPLAFAVAPGETTRLELDLAAYRPVALHLRAPEGANEISVAVHGAGATPLQWTTAAGASQALDLRPGTYTVRATSDSGASGEAELVVASESERTELEVVLESE